MKCSWCGDRTSPEDEGYADNVVWAILDEKATPIFFCSTVCRGHYVERRNYNKARAEENRKNPKSVE